MLQKTTLAQLLKSGDPRFKSGLQRKSHMHRVLIAVAGVARILDVAQTDANKDVLLKNGHIECAWTDIKEHPLWRLLDGCAAPTQFAPPEGRTRLRIVAVELRLDINVMSHRFLLQMPASTQLEKTREKATCEYVQELRGLVLIEKTAQLAAYQSGVALVLPPLPLEWGPVDVVQRMPCALWIRLV